MYSTCDTDTAAPTAETDTYPSLCGQTGAPGGHGGHAVKGVYHGRHAMVTPRSATERFVDSLNVYKERGITDRVRREAKVSDGWSSSYPMSMLVFVFGFCFLHYIVITMVVRFSITPFGGGYLSM